MRPADSSWPLLSPLVGRQTSQSRARRVSSANAAPITTAPTAARRKSLVDLHASLMQPTAMRVFTAMRTRSAWRVALCSVDRNVRRATGDVVVRSGRVAGCEPRARVDADSMGRDSIDRRRYRNARAARRPMSSFPCALFCPGAFPYGDACSISALSSAPARMAIPDM